MRDWICLGIFAFLWFFMGIPLLNQWAYKVTHRRQR